MSVKLICIFLGTHEWTDEEKETIEKGYYDEFSYLEETLSYEHDECEYVIYSGIDIEEV